MIEMYGATVVSGNREITTRLSFVADSGKRVAITGGNDSDKRTMLEALHGLVPLTEGWVCINGEPLLPQTASLFRNQTGYMPMETGLSTETVSLLIRQMLKFDSNADCIYSKKALLNEWKALNIDTSCYDMPFCDIAPDTAQRITLSLIGLFARPIALLHSPTSMQDADAHTSVIEYLMSPRFKDIATIIATDDDELLNICDNVIHLNTEET